MTEKSLIAFRRTNLLAGIALIVLLPSHSALAQSSPTQENTTRLSAIVVDGQGERGGTGSFGGYVAQQTTTGSKTATSIHLIPQSVSVVGREELADRAVITKIDEALLYSSGVVSQPYGSDPDTDWLYIRGFEASQNGLSLDNLPLTSTAYGNFQLDAFMQERIEVLKGPSSVLVGGANAGGLVNIVRKRPTAEAYFYTDIGINSDGNAFTSFDKSGSANEAETVLYRVTGKLAGGDHSVDETKDLRGFIMPQITFAPTDATSFTAYAYISGLDQTHTTNGLLPYVGTEVSNPFYGKISRDQYLGDSASNIGRSVQKMVGYDFSHEFENGARISQTSRYANLDKRERYIYAFDYLQTDALIGRYAEDIQSDANAFNIDNRIDGEFEMGATQHTLMGGVDYRYFRLDTDKYNGYPTSYDPSKPWLPSAMPALSKSSNQVVTLNQIGIYAQDQIRFADSWLVTLNGRYDFLSTQAIDRRSIMKDYKDNTGAFSGRAGLAYEFSNGLTPYASIATFFTPLIGTGVDGALKPEEGEQHEVGVKYQPSWFDGIITASLFQIDKDKYTVNLPGVGDKQLGSVRSRGIEFEGKANIDENWKVTAAATYTNLEFTSYPGSPALVGNSPYLIPSTTASLWLDYTVTEGSLAGLGIGAGARYRGKSWADNENTLPVSGAALVDAAIRYEKNGWEASFNVNNLFDTSYVAGCATQYFCGYGQARTSTLKLSKTF
jgi:iron complex outermembrane receptor protein